MFSRNLSGPRIHDGNCHFPLKSAKKNGAGPTPPRKCEAGWALRFASSGTPRWPAESTFVTPYAAAAGEGTAGIRLPSSQLWIHVAPMALQWGCLRAIAPFPPLRPNHIGSTEARLPVSTSPKGSDPHQETEVKASREGFVRYVARAEPPLTASECAFCHNFVGASTRVELLSFVETTHHCPKSFLQG
jgi:hypothetical protein